MVGTSGSEGMRARLVTANILALPAPTGARTEEVVISTASMLPDMMSRAASAPPR